MNYLYRFNATDKQVLAIVGQILKAIAASRSTRPAQLVTVAKVLHVLSRLPRVTKSVHATIELSMRIKQEGCSSSSSWQFSAGEGWLVLSCGGSEYTEGVGSDSFTTMTWSAQPGQRTEYDGGWDSYWMGSAGQSEADASSFSDLGECEISIDDDDNLLLCEPENSDSGEDEVG